MRNARRTRGFTLLELLVVIALMGVVSTLGTILFFEMNDSWRMMKHRADMDFQASQAFEALQDDFDHLVSPRLVGVPLQGLDGTVEDNERFYGQPLGDDQLSFPALVEVPGGASRCALVRYYVDPKTRGGESLLCQETLDFGVKPDQAVRLPVAQGVVRFEAEYQAEDGQWFEKWDRPTLPSAVRVSLALVHPDSGEQVTRKAVFPIRVR